MDVVVADGDNDSSEHVAGSAFDYIIIMKVVLFFPLRPEGPSGVTEKMDRMKIIKRRLSMSLRSARPVDDSLSELAEQMALDEASTARDNGERCERVPSHMYMRTH